MTKETEKKICEQIKLLGFPVCNIVHCVIVLMCLYIPPHSADRAEACDLCLYNALPTNTFPALSISVQLKHPAYYGEKTMYCFTKASFGNFIPIKGRKITVLIKLLW